MSSRACKYMHARYNSLPHSTLPLILACRSVSKKLNELSSSQNGCCESKISATGRSLGFLQTTHLGQRDSSLAERMNTHTVKQSSMNAIASGLIVSRTSSGIGGISPLAIL